MKETICVEMKNDFKKGLFYTEIGRKYNTDRRTAKKYDHSEHKPVYD